MNLSIVETEPVTLILPEEIGHDTISFNIGSREILYDLVGDDLVHPWLLTFFRATNEWKVFTGDTWHCVPLRWVRQVLHNFPSIYHPERKD